MSLSQQVDIAQVEGGDEIFNHDFLEYLIALNDRFTKTIHSLRRERDNILKHCLDNQSLPTNREKTQVPDDWTVPPVPEDLKQPGIEITGPASITGMFINALNPGPGGKRAEGDLDDDEDAAGHTLLDTVTAARNRLAAVKGTLEHYDKARDKEYKLAPGKIPFFMHRERGIHLDEPDVKINNQPIPACLLGAGLTMYYCGREQINQGGGLYFYLPKMESAKDAAFWREFFDFSKKYLNIEESSTIRAIPLIESLPLAFQMDEVLYALGPYAVGLNAARWDFKASIFEFVMTNPNSVWPDRFGVDIKTTPFLSNIFRRLVATCLNRGGIAIGGMATALPSKDKTVNDAAAKSIQADKQWEAEQGFLRGWVAHIFHMETAAEPFKSLSASGWKPSESMSNPDNYPISIDVPKGPVTLEGTHRNVRMVVEYVEGWLRGRGAKGIDSLEGKPGIHGPLMEDLATGRMSVAQIAQRIIHSVKDSGTGKTHTASLIKSIVQEELNDILKIRTEQFGTEYPTEYYTKAAKITLQWIKNYTELDFRSLGSYSREDLETISNSPDAL